MKKILILTFLFIALQLSAETYYCAPTTATPAGSDSNAGTIAAPFFTLNKAWTVLAAGDTILLRGGTYSFLSQQRPININGTITDTICIFAYPSEKPIFTKDASYSNNELITRALVELHGNYTYWKGIEIAGFTQALSNGVWSGMSIYNSSNNVFEELNIHHCGHGLMILQNSTNNLVLDCDFHHNYDPLSSTAYDNADGVGIEQVPSTATNTLRNCRAYRNGDDGFDCWDNEGMMTLDSCWSWHNGYREDGTTTGGDGNGIKLGRTSTSDGTTFRRTITNCLIFNNRNNGIDQNLANCRFYIYNNTVYDNKNNGIIIASYNLAHIIRNNVSFGNDNENYYGTITNATVDHNSYDDAWQATGPVASADDFTSVDSTGVSGARDSDGTMPVLDYLKPVTASDLKDVGTYVGIPFYGTAPDLGSFEFYVAPIRAGKKRLIIIR